MVPFVVAHVHFHCAAVISFLAVVLCSVASCYHGVCVPSCCAVVCFCCHCVVLSFFSCSYVVPLFCFVSFRFVSCCCVVLCRRFVPWFCAVLLCVSVAVMWCSHVMPSCHFMLLCCPSPSSRWVGPVGQERRIWLGLASAAGTATCQTRPPYHINMAGDAALRLSVLRMFNPLTGNKPSLSFSFSFWLAGLAECCSLLGGPAGLYRQQSDTAGLGGHHSIHAH